MSQHNIELATRALSKATELDPSNVRGLQQLSKQLDKLQQQQQQAAAATTGHAMSTGTNVSSPVSVSSSSSAMSCQTPLTKVFEGGARQAGGTEGTDDSDSLSRGAQQQRQQRSTQSAQSWDDSVKKAVASIQETIDWEPGDVYTPPDSLRPSGWLVFLLYAIMYGMLRACNKAGCFFLGKPMMLARKGISHLDGITSSIAGYSLNFDC